MPSWYYFYVCHYERVPTCPTWRIRLTDTTLHGPYAGSAGAQNTLDIIVAADGPNVMSSGVFAVPRP